MTAVLVNFENYRKKLHDQEQILIHNNFYLISTYIINSGPVPENLRLLSSGNREGLVDLLENFYWMKIYAEDLSSLILEENVVKVTVLLQHLTDIGYEIDQLQRQYNNRIKLVDDKKGPKNTIQDLHKKFKKLLAFLKPYSEAWAKYTQRKL